MIEKLFLTSMLGFMEDNTQTAVGMSVTVVYLMGLCVADPYVRLIDDRFSLVVQIHLLLTLLMGSILREHRVESGSLEDVLASFVLFLVLFILCTVLALNMLVIVRKW